MKMNRRRENRRWKDNRENETIRKIYLRRKRRHEKLNFARYCLETFTFKSKWLQEMGILD